MHAAHLAPVLAPVLATGTALGLWAAGVAAQAGAQPTTQQGWSELPLPALAVSPEVEASPSAPLSVTHLELPRDRFRPAPPARGFALPVASLIELLESDARREGSELRLLRTAPPLLARGSAAALERARSLLAELDRASAGQRVRLRAVLSAEGGAEPARVRSVVLRSGEAFRLGPRETRGFLAEFEVDVATGIGAADPGIGRIHTGRGAELRAYRSPLEDAVFVTGTLDLAELASLELVDTGSTDLGELHHPRVRSAVVRFSGLVRAGEELRVVLRGAPLAHPDWTLTVTAEPVASAGASWKVLDLAWLESELDEPGAPSPGAGIAAVPPRGVARGPEPLSSSILWGELEAGLFRRTSERPLFVVAPGLFAAPRGETAVWAEVDRLVAAACRARSATRRVTVTRGDLQVELPTAAGVPFRVQVGEERTVLDDYDTELAPEYWMAKPEVERAFDGLAVTGSFAGEELAGAWWTAESGAAQSLTRSETLHGRLELPFRVLTTGAFRIDGGGASDADAEVRVALAPVRDGED